MNPNPPSQVIEVEAKFLGGKEEFARITDWLKAEGFSAEDRGVVQRFHIYFDDGDTLRAKGCRLRCVVAIGEWFRYDFKVDDKPTATLEFSVKRHTPAPLAEIIDELVAQARGCDACNGLMKVRNTARIIAVFVGKHQKAVFRGPALELEVSWDVLTSLESGATISEVEVELVSGERGDFEKQISLISNEAKLGRIYGNKLERLMGGCH